MISVIGIKLVDLTLPLSDDETDKKIRGTYGLLSTEGRVMAKQSFNSQYGGETMKLDFSRETQKAMKDFMASVKKDIEDSLGFGTPAVQ